MLGLLRTGESAITMDDPTTASQFLGCDYHMENCVDKKGEPVVALTQNMEKFLDQ